MDKEKARKAFDIITGWMARTALQGGGSVHGLADAMLAEAEAEPNDLLLLLEIIISADLQLEELNLPEDNEPLKVATGAKGFSELAAYLYGFGALRYLRLETDQPMGVDMWGSLAELLQSLRDSAPELLAGTAVVHGPPR